MPCKGRKDRVFNWHGAKHLEVAWRVNHVVVGEFLADR